MVDLQIHLSFSQLFITGFCLFIAGVVAAVMIFARD